MEEALSRLDSWLDDALRGEINPIIVIHGHGTGVLKKAVREFLDQSPYILSSRPGEKGEGGDGVTVALLRG